MNLLTLSSALPFIFPPFFCFVFFFSFGIVLSCPCVQSYCVHQGMHVVVTTAMRFHLMMEDELPFVPSLSFSLSPRCYLNLPREKQRHVYIYFVLKAQYHRMCELECPVSRNKM